MTDRPPTLLEVERLRQGLLDADATARVEARLAAFGDPTADLPDDVAVFAEDPPERFVRNVLAAKAEQEAVSRRRRALRVAVPLLVAAVALFVVTAPPTEVAPDGPDIVLKADGPPVLRATLDGPEGPTRLADGDVVHAGDRVQLSFAAPGLSHGVLYSVDGRGTVTVHHRFGGDHPVPGTITLPTAYALDDAPSFEAFHLVAAAGAFDVQAVLDAAGAAGRGLPRLPAGTETATLVLRKGPR